MNARRLARAAAALALVAGSLAVPVTAASVLTAAPAAAATCGGGPGVTVVVDRASLGGGVTTGCDGDGGTATDNFADTGVALSYAQREPGFVCRVNGVPQSDPCQNASPSDAYWGLWWSDGSSGRWRYSSVGVGSLSVPAGGSVAFRFSTGDSTPPAVAPPVRASGSDPGGSEGSGGSGSSGSTGGSSSGGGAAPTTAAPTSPGTSTPTPTPTPSPDVDPAPTSAAPTPRVVDREDGDRRERASASARGDRAGARDSTDLDRRERTTDRRGPSVTRDPDPDADQGTTLVDDTVDPRALETPVAAGLPVWVAPVLVVGLLLLGGAAAGVRRVRGARDRP